MKNRFLNAVLITVIILALGGLMGCDKMNLGKQPPATDTFVPPPPNIMDMPVMISKILQKNLDRLSPTYQRMPIMYNGEQYVLYSDGVNFLIFDSQNHFWSKSYRTASNWSLLQNAYNKISQKGPGAIAKKQTIKQSFCDYENFVNLDDTAKQEIDRLRSIFGDEMVPNWRTRAYIPLKSGVSDYEKYRSGWHLQNGEPHSGNPHNFQN